MKIKGCFYWGLRSGFLGIHNFNGELKPIQVSQQFSRDPQDCCFSKKKIRMIVRENRKWF